MRPGSVCRDERTRAGEEGGARTAGGANVCEETSGDIVLRLLLDCEVPRAFACGGGEWSAAFASDERALGESLGRGRDCWGQSAPLGLLARAFVMGERFGERNGCERCGEVACAVGRVRTPDGELLDSCERASAFSEGCVAQDALEFCTDFASSCSAASSSIKRGGNLETSASRKPRRNNSTMLRNWSACMATSVRNRESSSFDSGFSENLISSSRFWSSSPQAASSAWSRLISSFPPAGMLLLALGAAVAPEGERAEWRPLLGPTRRRPPGLTSGLKPFRLVVLNEATSDAPTLSAGASASGKGGIILGEACSSMTGAHCPKKASNFNAACLECS